jgi:hypothetical protein
MFCAVEQIQLQFLEKLRAFTQMKSIYEQDVPVPSTLHKLSACVGLKTI